MTNTNVKSKEGFTIIEVVLVLAIAGLIFLMVFIALPALQRSQRDTQRRDDMARVADAITSYQTNNNGKLPSDGATFLSGYLTKGGGEFKDPDGSDYTVNIYAYGKEGTDGKAKNEFSGDKTNHTITIVTSAKCDGEVSAKSNNPREYAILYNLEGSGTSCTDNQ